MRHQHSDRRSGFTLIELLIVIAIIGVIAAILVPNLLTSLQKARQKSTMNDMRSLGAAWMSWLTDQAGAASAGSSTFDFSQLADDLEPQDPELLLAPDSEFFYIRQVPTTDGWGNALDYQWNSSLTAAQIMGIRSFGRDHLAGPTENPYPIGAFVATHFDEDIVWSDGLFVRYPLGAQTQ